VQLYNRLGKPSGEGSIIYEGARKMADKYTAFLGGDSPYGNRQSGQSTEKQKNLVI
jgi:hypothetical protein